jgi:TIR domain
LLYIYNIILNILLYITEIRTLQRRFFNFTHKISPSFADSLSKRQSQNRAPIFAEDNLAAARAQADQLLNLLADTLRTHGQYIQPDILRRIEKAREELQRAMQSRDAAELASALAALCNATNMKPPATEAAPKVSSPSVAVKATTSRHSVFISYARNDRVWLDRLRTHLVPLERHGKVEIWHDGKIESGALWQSEIEEALAKASVAILLVSANFMASAFIYDHELPPILERNQAHGICVLPVFIGHCYYQRDPVLSRFNAFNDPKLPISAMPDAEAEAQLARLAGDLWKRLDPT